MPETCIMGFAHGRDYSWAVLRPFVRSLREKAGYTGSIVLYTNDNPRESGVGEADLQKLAGYGVTIMPVDLSWIPWGQGFMMARFWQQEQTIRDHPEWQRVVLVDTRDMIWQKNLDVFFQDDQLHVQQESIRIIDDAGFNSEGVLVSWGQAVLDEIGQQPVLNSGSIWGGREAVLNLLEQMHQCGAKPNCDQHALMYQVWKLQLPVVNHPNDGSMVWTVGVLPGFEYGYAEGVVQMADGHVPPCVHQYDRHASLKARIEEYYRD